jgi:YVTN family beta-propeller protein
MTTTRTCVVTHRRTVPVGDAPHLHIGYVSEADRIWVSNTGGDTITLLDATTGEPAGEFSPGIGPAHFAFDKGCRIGYVALYGGDGVAVVDPLHARRVNVIPLPAGSQPLATMPAFDRNRIYTLNQGNATVSAIDTETNTVAATIDVGGHPQWAQPWGSSYKPITRPVGKSYVVSTDTDDVTVFDDATDTVIKRIKVGHRPSRNAIYRERAEIYVSNAHDNTVSVIPISTDEVVATVPVGVDPFRLLPVQAINGRDEMWVLNHGSTDHPAGEISIISGAGQRVVGTIPVMDRPANWVVNSAGLLFVVGAGARELQVVDIRQGKVVGRADLPAEPHPDAVSGLIFTRAGLLFVLNADKTVAVFDVTLN